MKNKILVLLIVLVLGATFVFASACKETGECNHVLKDVRDSSTCTADGVKKGVCTICGKTIEVESKAHHTYDEDGICTVCGYEKWDGVSIPTIEQIGEYANRYLPNIMADTYVDFATEYDIDLEKHPDLYDSGMFWCYYDETVGAVREVSMRDHDKVDELIEKGLIDSAKPTIIFTHGLGVDTYKKVYVAGEESMCSEIYDTTTQTLDPNDPVYADYVEPHSGLVNLNLIYLKNGYNVINFSYRRFADEGAVVETKVESDGLEYEFAYANNMVTESKIYSLDGPGGMRYRYESGNFSDGDNVFDDAEPGVVREDIDFTLGEYFAAEYVRMFNYMVEKNVFNENSVVQCSGHSMGGVVTVIGNFLVSELVRVGQIPSYYLADRLMLEDTYLGVYTNYQENIPDFADLDSHIDKLSLKLSKMLHVGGLEVHWTGKKLDGCGSFGTYLGALYQLVNKYDMPVEYYIDMSIKTFASLPASKVRHLIMSLCATQMYNMTFKCDNTHNGIREFRVASIIPSLMPKDNNGNYAVSSALSDDEIRARRGVIYYQTEGNKTATLTDDVFTIRPITDFIK